MRIVRLLLATIAILGWSASAPSAPNDEEWLQLFNGRDLTGWTPKISKYALGDNYANTFRVEKGVLKVSYDGYTSFDGRFGHLFYEKPFSYYRLVVEYRFVGEQAPNGPGSWALRNSGVMLHSQNPRTMTLMQNFPISLHCGKADETMVAIFVPDEKRVTMKIMEVGVYQPRH